MQAAVHPRTTQSSVATHTWRHKPSSGARPITLPCPRRSAAVTAPRRGRKPFRVVARHRSAAADRPHVAASRQLMADGSPVARATSDTFCQCPRISARASREEGLSSKPQAASTGRGFSVWSGAGLAGMGNRGGGTLHGGPYHHFDRRHRWREPQTGKEATRFSHSAGLRDSSRLIIIM